MSGDALLVYGCWQYWHYKTTHDITDPSTFDIWVMSGLSSGKFEQVLLELDKAGILIVKGDLG